MEIIKRDGRTVLFDKQKIVRVVDNASRETLKGIDSDVSRYVSEQVEEILDGHVNVTVEDIHDLVETLLMETPRKDVAKKYILYRAERSRLRGKKVNKYKILTDSFMSQYKHKPSPLNQLGSFVYYRTYSRWLSEEGRREYWHETCRRAVEYNCSLTPTSQEEAQQLFDNMFNLKQFLSGRTLWTGFTEVSKKFPMSNFNCSAVVIDNIQAFSDLFYLLMLGAGVGIRCLFEDIKKLPKFKTTMNVIHQDYMPVEKCKRIDNTSMVFLSNDTVEIIIGDSKTGWTTALHYCIELYTSNAYKEVDKVIINYNHVRPFGEKLKTFGGTASGHTAVKKIITKIHKIVSKEQNMSFISLKPIDVIDICNVISEGVVVGGVRRSAQASLISANDSEAIQAKSNLYIQNNGKWIENEAISHRKMSNNSIYYEQKPTREQLHWHINQLKQSGEPGFLNSIAAIERYDNFKACNPCFEVLLPDKGVCNLVTINVSAFVENGTLDTESLFEAQRLNTRAAYRMSTVELELSHWNVPNKTDKILGVSITGWQDAIDQLQYNKRQEETLLLNLWETSFAACEEISKELNDKQPVAFSVIKPEGTISLLPGVSAGIHHSHSPYYLRRVRINANDPLVKVCEELQYPIFLENGQTEDNVTTKVIEFPCKSPVKKTKNDITAIEQLENYKLFMDFYVDGNASVTVTVKEDEWELVEQWLWDNWNSVVAVSFLSHHDSFYPLMPFEEITKEEYEERIRSMKPFIPSLLSKYEQDEVELDVSSMSDCEGGVCSIR